MKYAKLLVLMVATRPSQRALSNTRRATRENDYAGEQLANWDVSHTEDAFVSSAARGDAVTVELILASGLSPNVTNRDGFTALMWSAGQGHMLVVETLLARGAHVNALSKDGTTALMAAASQGHTQIARLLVARGAAVDARRADGWTALIWSAAEGQEQSVRMLLAMGRRSKPRILAALLPCFMLPLT